MSYDSVTPKAKLPLLLKVIIALASLFLLLAFALTLWRFSMSSGNESRFKAIKAAGEPATARELDAWYEAVDEKENAALVWLAGVEQLNPRPGKNQPLPWSRIKMPARGERLSAAQLQMAAESLTNNKEALATFRRAATLTKSRYPVDFSQGMFADLDHLSQLKSASSLLQLEALVHAHHGRSGEAVESIKAMLGAARSLAQEPILISQLVRSAIHNQAVSVTERALNLIKLSDAQLAELQASFAAAEFPNLTTRALIGERACTATMLNTPHELTPPSNPQALENSIATQKGFGSALMRASGFLERDLGYFLDAMATNIAVSQLPAPDEFHSRTNLEEIELRARRQYYVMSSMLLPALSRTTVKDVESQARLRAAQTALAVERYRLANAGRLPTSLDMLAPKYLTAKPIDPFDGEPLRFKTKPQGYVVYCLGQDLNDDDGTPLPSGSLANKTPHDIPFIIEK